MPQVRIWCGAEGELEDLDDELSAANARTRRMTQPNSRKAPPLYEAEVIARMHNTVSSPEELVEFIKSHGKVFVHRGKQHAETAPSLLDAKIDRAYFGMLSNHNVAPQNGVTNWGGFADDRPTGYLGFNFELRLEFSGPVLLHIDQMFKGTNIKLGIYGKEVTRQITGQRGIDLQWRSVYLARCEVFMFLDDWPALEQAVTISRLSGGNKLVEEYYRELSHQ